jgi:flagellar protein FlbD
VVILTRPTGERLALNPDLIERVEERRLRTIVTLVDGAKYLVAESLQVVSERMLAYRQAVIAGPAQEPTRLRIVD